MDFIVVIAVVIVEGVLLDSRTLRTSRDKFPLAVGAMQSALFRGAVALETR